jgi:hypothetical protein
MHLRALDSQSNPSHLEALARELRDAHAIATASPSRRLDAAMAGGDAINAAREHLKHGELGTWLEACGIGQRVGRDYTALAENRATIEAYRHGRADFGIKEALRLIGRCPDRMPASPSRSRAQPSPTRPTSHLDILKVWDAAPLSERQRAIDSIGLAGLQPAIPETWLPCLQRWLSKRQPAPTPYDSDEECQEAPVPKAVLN